ncbi:MAG: alpha-L-fucosidase [Kiritimatiellae bacterium]|nr:alpha-L-fucosidase [Kiritimatiellia bacterium]
MKRILLLLLLLSVLPRATAENVPPERLRAREAFAEKGFGIFVHWGVYAAWGKGEWYLNKSRMPLADYETKAAAFNPTRATGCTWPHTTPSSAPRISSPESRSRFRRGRTAAPPCSSFPSPSPTACPTTS